VSSPDLPPSPDGSTLRLLGEHGAVPLGFVREEGVLFLIARERSSLWPIHALREGTVHVELGGQRAGGPVTLVGPGPERARVLGLFESKYGSERYRRWYAKPARVLQVRLGSLEPIPTSTEHYYDWLEAEFDNVAAEYDHHILGNRMNRFLRDRSLALMVPTFADAHRLLEIGCGSGLETLTMLRGGHEVTAVDISEQMLAVVREKARREGLSERLQTVRARASSLGVTLTPDTAGRFDGAYSTYGALNCESDLRPIRDGLGSLLPTGSPLVLGIYNRWCAFELAAYSLTLRGGRAFGRRTNPVLVGDSRFCIDVFAYSPRDIEREFAPEFRARSNRAVPLILPPSDLTGYSEKFSRHFDTLSRWDGWLGRRPLFAGLGDHFLMVLERTAAGNRPVLDPPRPS
jgi:SAM-dependent methyltransferase